MSLHVIEPDYTWDGRRFVEGLQILVNTDGWIQDVGKLQLPATHRLPSQALIPGLINSHSHAFQRALRGRGESFPRGRDSYWGWLQEVKKLASAIDSEAMYTLCRQAFSEMLSAGITTVGEFHFLRHESGVEDYRLDNALLKAAEDSGIRLVLMSAFFKSEGVGKPHGPELQPFATPNLASYWKQLDELGRRLGKNQHLGTAAHSLFCAPLDDIKALVEESRRRGQVFHLQLEEHRKEVEECLAFYGDEPMALILEHCRPGPYFTAIHCTQSLETYLEAFLDSGANVCLCPLSEANLGNGLPAQKTLQRYLDQICLGTGSNSRISMHEEARWLELAHRLDAQKRGIWLGDQGHLGKQLLQMSSRNGARSLGIKAGMIQPGYRADFASIDLNSPGLEGCEPTTLAEALLLGTDTETIASTWVGGHLVFSRSWLTHLSSI